MLDKEICVYVNVLENGKITIPIEVREELKIEKGQRLQIKISKLS